MIKYIQMGQRIRKTRAKTGLRAAAAVAVVLSCAACITLPKPLYFTLDMTTPPGEGAISELADGRSLSIDAIRVTDKLVRRDVLIRLNATEYEYYHDAKWIAQVSDLVKEKLEVEFTPAEPREAAHPFLVYGTLLAFEQVDESDGTVYAHVKLEAQFRREGASRYDELSERVYEFYAPVDAPEPLPKRVVDKLSEGLEAIAREMAEDVNSLPLS